MLRNAHISFGGGGLILPAQTPYERQLVFEHVEASAKHHEHLGLSAGGHHWRIMHRSDGSEICTRCGGSLHHLAYRESGRSFCGRCVRRALI